MSHNVFANLWQVAAKAGKNRSIGRFPDVCLSPPAPPAGPIPIPYPDTSFSTDLKEGSDTVQIGGMPAALAQQSYYQPSTLGNEAATKNFGCSVITHTITGKTVFQAWSMDVKFEGKNVCRHIDITTSNHNCPPPGTPPAPSLEAQTIPDTEVALKNKKCPCCGEPLHDWQKKEPMNPDSEALDTIPEDDFYAGLAKRFADKEHTLFLGRGALFPIAMEGALKLKEISYIHAEGYPAGELKHGPLALVDADMPVITVAPNNDLLEKLKSNLMEVRARGGELIVFADPESGIKPSDGVTVIQMPKHVTYFQAPVVYTIPLQLLAYHVAILRGTDVDQPRNLAKSVTVE